MYEDRITCDIMTKFVNSIYDSKEFFFGYGIVLFSRGKVFTDVVDIIRTLLLFLFENNSNGHI